MAKTNFQMVEEFHEKFNLHPSIDVQLKLILEELREMLFEVPSAVYANDMWYLIGDDEYRERMGRLTKEAVDLLYVVYGLLHRIGVDADKAFQMVHESNMSKLGKNGKPVYREDGKLLKGDNYTPIDPYELFKKTCKGVTEK